MQLVNYNQNNNISKTLTPGQVTILYFTNLLSVRGNAASEPKNLNNILSKLLTPGLSTSLYKLTFSKSRLNLKLLKPPSSAKIKSQRRGMSISPSQHVNEGRVGKLGPPTEAVTSRTELNEMSF